MTFVSLNSDRSLGTGLLNPLTEAFVTVNAGDPAKFDLSAGSAQFVDASTDPLNPQITTIEWDAFIGVTLDNLATENVTYLYVDINGDIVQSTVLLDGSSLRDLVAVGVATHVNRTTITNIDSATQTVLSSSNMSFADHSSATAPINSVQGGGNIVTGKSGGTSLIKSEGIYYNFSLNSRNDLKSPNLDTSPELEDSVMIFAWRNTDTSSPSASGGIAIPSGIYDDGTALSIDPLPVGVVEEYEWTVHKLTHAVNINQMVVLFGQHKYQSKLEAINAARYDPFFLFDAVKGGVRLCTVVMRGGATDFGNPDDVEIVMGSPARSDWR